MAAAPIRVAIIGLSASAITSWASTAHLPYLLSPRGRTRYTIVALCNSSVDAARAAIRAFDLPPEPATRAYGDPESLAADPDVDLVVCCTRVDVHYRTILPSVRTGKHVFVEWPLAQDEKRARELVQAARGGGGRTLVGMQGRVAPPVVKLQQLIGEGRIGKVLSSEVRAFGGSHDRERLAVGLKCFTELDIGGNIVTIGFGHCKCPPRLSVSCLTAVHERTELTTRMQYSIRSSTCSATFKVSKAASSSSAQTSCSSTHPPPRPSRRRAPTSPTW